jgi:hypothetical protein
MNGSDGNEGKNANTGSRLPREGSSRLRANLRPVGFRPVGCFAFAPEYSLSRSLAVEYSMFVVQS